MRRTQSQLEHHRLNLRRSVSKRRSLVIRTITHRKSQWFPRVDGTIGSLNDAIRHVHGVQEVSDDVTYLCGGVSIECRCPQSVRSAVLDAIESVRPVGSVVHIEWVKL